MSESLFSASWYRVAELRPRLRSHAQIHRHIYRGSVWYVLQNHGTGRFHRFTPIANVLIGLMNGERTVAEIWSLAAEILGDQVPTQDETIRLLAELHRAEVLQSDSPPDVAEMERRRKKHLRNRLKQYLGNPLSLRFPLFDPDRLINALMPLARPFLNWTGVAVWVLVVGFGLIELVANWRELSSDMLDRVFSVENLLLMALVYPLIKLLHELAHALMVKAGGGEIHELGIMFLVFLPIPYVDASSSTAFSNKRDRMLVGAAGILAELFIAALAMLAWTQLPPGIERAIAYNVLILTSISTLLFNGNPLLRYDGYYVLADFLEIPNLAQRANAYVGYLVSRHLFGVGTLHSPSDSRSESGWLLFYAIASFAYRMFMMVSIALLVASRFFFVGLILAAWAILNMLILPLLKSLRYLHSSPVLVGRRFRAIMLTGSLVSGLGLVIFMVPAPSTTVTEGVIWAPENTAVRPETGGFVEKVFAQNGAQVASGEPLVQLADPELDARIEGLRAQIEELESRFQTTVLKDRVEADQLLEQRAQIIEMLDVALSQWRSLLVTSPVSGRFVTEDLRDLEGQYWSRGMTIGHVLDAHAQLVRVIVTQSEVDLVRNNTRMVEVRPSGDLDSIVRSRLLREIPASTDELPSMSLSIQGGGKVGLEPGQTDAPRTIEQLFVFDLQLPDYPRVLNLLGARVHVRFVHDREPLSRQWYRAVRRLFLSEFDV